MQKFRTHRKLWIISTLFLGILLIFVRKNALASVLIRGSPDRQYQTVPTMPPPTKSPTITPFTTQPIPPLNTPTQSPHPSAAVTQVTSLPPTQTIEAVASATAEVLASSTISTEPSNPTTNPTTAEMVGAGTNIPGTASPKKTAVATSTGSAGKEGGGSSIWWYGVIIAVVVLVLAVSLYIWLNKKRRADGNSSTQGSR
jgi:hypothetical protein